LPSPSEDVSYTSPATLTERYSHFTNLDDFLAYYYRGIAVVVHQEDFEMLAWEYFTTAAKDGVRHAEVFFDPQSHTERGIDFDVVVRGFNAARVRAEKELGITSCLIMCFLRHLPASSAADTMALAVKGGHFDVKSDSQERAITGLGLDSSEVGFRPELFVDMYREGEKRGLRRTAHAGEEGDPTYISGALDALQAERIDHGIRLTDGLPFEQCLPPGCGEGQPSANQDIPRCRCKIQYQQRRPSVLWWIHIKQLLRGARGLQFKHGGMEDNR
jgi:adenosine deaminase